MKRWGMRIGISTLLGLLTTIGVAWLCARYVRLGFYDKYADGMTVASSSGWFLRAYRRAGAEYVTGSPLIQEMDRCAPPGTYDDLLEPDEIKWSSEYPPVKTVWGSHTQVVNVRGWPLPAFSCVLRETIGGRSFDQTIDGGIIFEGEGPVRALREGVERHALTVPLRPVWPNLVGDVAFYGTAWCVVLSIASLLRRRIRYVTWRVAVASMAVSLVGGVLSTVAVSWFCALWIELGIGPWTQGYGRSTGGTDYMVWWVYRSERPSAVRLRSHWLGRSRRGWGGSGPGPDGPVDDFLPDFTDYLTPGDDDSIRRVLDARGWPMLAMWGGFEAPQIVESESRAYVATLGKARHAIVLPRYYED